MKSAQSGDLSRRQFVAAGAVGLAAIAAGCQAPSVKTTARHTARKRIALIGTHVIRHSHAQHFVDRFLEGYGWQGQWHHPAVDLVSLYIDQFPAADLARERSARFKVPLYPTVEEALTLGGSKLAVDGVVIIGEHGQYPKNEKGQTLYPRYKWFKQITKIFEASGRAVPVFNDKHLSTEWNECVEMVNNSKRLKFPFLAGSSLPVTWRIPSIDFPLGASLRESVSICYGGVDSYDFHGLETAQCMSERRAGNESGVRSVHAVRGEKVWSMLEARPVTKKLFFSALARSHSVKAPPGQTVGIPTIDWARKASTNPVAYFFEHNDGLLTTMFLCNGFVQDFTYAGQLKDQRIISCHMHLPMPNHISSTADFFNPLVNHIEQMVVTGRVPYPVERTLLTSGMTLRAVESLFRGQNPISTPDLKVAYTPAPGPNFWRA